MASTDDKPWSWHSGGDSSRRDQGGTAGSPAAASARASLERAFAAAVAAMEDIEKSMVFPEGKETMQKEAAYSRKHLLLARDGMHRALAAAESADLDELSVEDLQERHDQSKRDEERVRAALVAKQLAGICARLRRGAASATAFALTDGEASDSDAWEHLAKAAAPKVAEEFRLYYSTQGQVDDIAKQQEMLETIVARNYRAQASVAAGAAAAAVAAIVGGALPAGGHGDGEDLGGGTVPPTCRPDGGTEAAAAERSSKRRLTESG